MGRRWSLEWLLAAAAVALAVGSLWIGGRRDPAELAPLDVRFDPESSASPAPEAESATRDRILTARWSADNAALESSVSPPDPLDHGTGVLHLRFVDAQSDRPLAGLEFGAFSERGSSRRLGHGVSDAQGRATLNHLPEDTVIVETTRTPPYAMSWAATWMSPGEVDSLEVRVFRGGRVRGRVVDTVGPVVGSKIYARELAPGTDRHYSWWESHGPVVAETDEEGRFSISALRDRVRSVWIVDGEPDPRGSRPVRLAFGSGANTKLELVSVDDGLEVDLGDVALPTGRVLRGRLRDTEGNPVEGALVSGMRERANLRRGGGTALNVDPNQPCPWWHPRNSAQFQLECGEALTDDAGRFEVVFATTGIMELWIETREGLQELIPVELPDDPSREVDITLTCRALLFLELIDDEGQRAPQWSGTRRSKRLRFPSPRFGSPLDAATMVLSTISRSRFGAARLLCEAGLDPDGRYRASLPVSLSEVSGLELEIANHEPVAVPLDSGLSSGDVVTVRVHRLEPETLRVRARARVDHVRESSEWRVNVRASLRPDQDDGDLQLYDTLDASAVLLANDTWQELSFDVHCSRPHWLHLRTRDGEIRTSETLGPFFPGEAVIDLPEIVLLDKVAPEPPDTGIDRWGAYRGQAGVLRAALSERGMAEFQERLAQPPARLRVHLRDAQTQEPLESHALVVAELIPPTDELLFRQPLTVPIHAGLLEATVPHGTWRFTLRPLGHRAIEFDPVLEPGGQVDLGWREVEPTLLAVHFEAAAGRSLEDIESVSMGYIAPFTDSWTTSRLDHSTGDAVFDGDPELVDGLFLTWPSMEGHGLGGGFRKPVRASWFHPLERDGRSEWTVQLPEKVSALVWIRGGQPGDRFTPMTLKVHPLSTELPPWLWSTARELPCRENGARRFHLSLYPGEFECVLDSALYELHPDSPGHFTLLAGRDRELSLAVRERVIR